MGDTPLRRIVDGAGVTPLQGSLEIVGTFTWASSPGFNGTGFQPYIGGVSKATVHEVASSL